MKTPATPSLVAIDNQAQGKARRSQMSTASSTLFGTRSPRRSSSPLFLEKQPHKQVHSKLYDATPGCTPLVMASRAASSLTIHVSPRETREQRSTGRICLLFSLSAVGDEQTPDEAIHAAGLQFYIRASLALVSRRRCKTRYSVMTCSKTVPFTVRRLPLRSTRLRTP
ncbi:hypothetical protein DFH29DRAFT_606216 [Suillus ampliporus]|nr:hypothetical protein DFH29DRAFT_606216 [Suillus ampliporus]